MIDVLVPMAVLVAGPLAAIAVVVIAQLTASTLTVTAPPGRSGVEGPIEPEISQRRTEPAHG